MIVFFKQKTAFEMRISDWSSDVCSSDLRAGIADVAFVAIVVVAVGRRSGHSRLACPASLALVVGRLRERDCVVGVGNDTAAGERLVAAHRACAIDRSEEHTSELQSLMRISYAVFCLKKQKTHHHRKD